MNKKITLIIIATVLLIALIGIMSCTQSSHASLASAPAPASSHPDTIYFPKVPGAINPNVTQDNIKSTICVSGWTKTIRPPASYTNKLKIQQMAALGLTGSPHDYEEDHAVPLEIGGNPTDPNNLWPEPWNGPEGAHKKDVVETRLKNLVCNGTISLNDAQNAIITNWEEAYQKYVIDNK